MAYLHNIADRVRRGERLSAPWDIALRAATPITRLGMQWRLHQRVETVDATVISYGNITAGGTGKTPAVIACVQEQIAAGHRVAVVTRGYGSARVPEPFVVPADMPRAEVARLAGDEPALIRQHAPDCVVVKAASRVNGARAAILDHGCEVIVLDDGFQHVQLARDRNICLIDASSPFGNGFLLPRGVLREPLSALRRATHLEVTRCDQAVDLDSLLARLTQLAPGIPVRTTMHTPCGLWRVSDGKPLTWSDAREQRVTAVSAIGHPEAFHRTLVGLGFTLDATRSFADHASITPEALRADGLVILTEKDAMRLNSAPDNVYALEIVLQDFPGRA